MDPKQKSTWRLPLTYKVIQMSGILVPIIVATFVKIHPEYFTFFVKPALFANLLLTITAIHVTLFWLQEKTGHKFFYTISRWAWIVFWLSLMHITGGIHTYFLFLLMFPILVAIADLDVAATRHVAIVVTGGFGLIFLFGPIDTYTLADYVGHATRTFIFGVVAYYLYTIVKETIRHKIEKEEAKKQFVELIEVDKVKSGFVEVASHQLRGPLTSARWGLSSLFEKGSQLPDEEHRLLRGIQNEIERAISIVNEMLKTAEFGSPGVTVARREVNLNSLLGNIVTELSGLVHHKGVSLHFEESKVCYQVEGDSRLLHACFQNIIDNAVRYSPKGDVYVSVSCDDKSVTVTVRDTGMGIEEEDIPYLFERFYRGKNAISLEPNESGVGLYIAKKIVDFHSGDITVDSVVKKGTTVTVTLPQKYAHPMTPHA